LPPIDPGTGLNIGAGLTGLGLLACVVLTDGACIVVVFA
jgi:hypothetical protein